MKLTKSITEILPDNYEVKKINKEDFVFLEGPVWDKDKEILYFTDPLASKVYMMAENSLFKSVFEDSGYANGMCLNLEGNLVICKMDSGSIEEINPLTGKQVRTISKGYNNKAYNATNDVIFDSKGGYYITDPFFTYGPKTQDTEATYYCSDKGQTIRVANDSIKPNGLALSPDEKYLYIDDTGSINIWRYEVEKDGTLKNGKVFCKLIPPEHIENLPYVQHFGEADGMKVDVMGNIYVTTYTGIQIFNQEGEYLGIIKMPDKETASNIVFGGRDLTTLYITARTSLYCVNVLIPGLT